MIRRLTTLIALALLLPGAARAFTVTGRFLYEDRMWDKAGYTGQVQNLPIRHAGVEVVDAATQQVLGSGVTDTAGSYAVGVTGQTLPVNLYVRCLTDGRPAGYEVQVVDDFVRVPLVGLELTHSRLYAIATDTTIAHDPATDLDKGTSLIQDTDGTGVAQAFNIFDNGVDFFDWVASVHGALPTAAEFLVYAWMPAGSPGNAGGGSNYSMQGVFIGASPNSDTDGWSDTVILHESGHWLDDVFSKSDNPGGAHYLGDNDANVLLAYGEGSATYHCAKVRELRALTRQNLVGQPVDAHVSIYGDLEIPPPVGTPGALSFSYDFETGLMGDGSPIGQRGTANETNVTSALWDLLDGPETPDESTGADDDPVDVADSYAWNIEHNYLRNLADSNPITVEDYFQGWFVLNGTGFLRAGLETVFADLALMPFRADELEPDNIPASAPHVTPAPYTATAAQPVISELDPGPRDAVELYNGTPTAIDMTGWQVEVYVNGVTNDATRVFTFPSFTLSPGEVVVVHEGGDVAQDGTIHLYGGSAPGAGNLFSISWHYGLDGACVLRRPDGGAVDFVRWRDGNGVENSTPVPAGVAWNGALDSPTAPNDLLRDVSGTDTDAASDFHGGPGSTGSANHPAPVHHTTFDVGDLDLVAFDAEAGKRYGFEARGPFSATDMRLELLGPDGQVLGANNDMDLSVRDARIDFYAANPGTYYVRATHVGPNTDYGEYDLLAFVRPVNVALAPPSSIAADARNREDAADEVRLRWLNAGAYDSVALYRDSTRIALLAGAPSTYTDHADRGLHRWEVTGFVGGQETARTGVYEFAGVVTCHLFQGFEEGNSDLWITDGTTWGVTAPGAETTLFSFTDSPAGPYRGAPLGDKVNAIATLSLPADLPPGSTLDFDQICITEGCCDFGIVEASVNDGATWTELGRWSQDSYPEWQDNVANPGDWKHQTVDLSGFAYSRLLLRLRLESDQLVELDGWYVDDLKVNDSTCTDVSVGVEPLAAGRLRLMPPTPNPARGPARLSWVLPARADRVDLASYDGPGRMVRYERLGPQAGGAHAWTWDGHDAHGQPVASGVYFARLLAGRESLTQKLMKLAP